MDYKYVAIGQGNVLLRGSVVAGDPASAEEHLTQRGVRVISMEPSRGTAFLPKVNLKSTKVTKKEITIFSQQLASLLDAGVPLTLGLQLLRDQAKGDAFKDVMGAMIVDLASGQSLSAAMRNHPKTFPVVYTRLVEAGERSGTLDVVLGQLAAYLTRETAMTQKIKKALTYPVIVSVVGTVVMAILIMFVLPAMTGMLKTFNVQMPLITRIVIAVGDAGQKGRVPILLGTLLAAGVTTAYLQRPSGRMALARVLMKMPLLGKVVVQLNLARSSQTLALLLAAGLPVPEGLSLARDSAPNLAFQESLVQIRAGVMEGKSLAHAMAEAPVIPGLYAQMVRIGEESGTLEKNLRSMAAFYEREVDEQIETLTSLLEPTLTVVMGIGVAILALAMLLPMMSVLNSVGGAPG